MQIAKVALITGAGRRIGAAIAQTLHDAEYNIILHCNFSQKDASILCNSLNNLRSNSACVICHDLNCKQAELVKFVQMAANIWGRIDVLVQNAAVFFPTDFSSVTYADWDALFSINAKIPFFLSLAAAKFLRKVNGSIVNICDIHGANPLRNYSIYCMTKAALIMQTKVLAQDLAPDIRVNGVSPGGGTAWPEGINKLDNSIRADILKKIPLNRFAKMQDIASAVKFLVQNAAYITGNVLNIDGGRSICS